ncbi:MAG: succinylglutamate desuccinylase/aspartoacylase family protein [Myxococcota bacterium]
MFVETLSALDLSRVPTGVVSRFWLSLAHDAFGEPIRVPILVARGTRDGPVCGITAAVHGNEVNGIPVIHRLLERLDVQKLRGTVVAVPVVNTAGFHLRTRRTDDGVDLNHAFPGKPQGREHEVYAWRFFERVVRQVDLLMDLHTASFGRVNCLYIRADLTDPDTTRMAMLNRPQIIVHNPPLDGTLRGAAHHAGIPAVTIEIGNPHRINKEYVRRSVAGIRAVLSSRGMVTKRPITMSEPPVICQQSGWSYTQSGGLLSVAPKVTEHVKKGQPLSRIVNIFGDLVEEYAAPHDGSVVAHSGYPVAQTGARSLHLGVVAPPDSPLIPRL